MIYFIFYLVVGLIFALSVARYIDDSPVNNRVIFILNFLFWPLVIGAIITELLLSGIVPLLDLMIRLSRFGRKK